MKTETKCWILLGTIFIFVWAISVFIYNPSTRFWNDVYERSIDWCYKFKPQFNITQNEDVKFCFNEGWKDYCKVQYQDYC